MELPFYRRFQFKDMEMIDNIENEEAKGIMQNTLMNLNGYINVDDYKSPDSELMESGVSQNPRDQDDA